jgi:hypothetical protein
MESSLAYRQGATEGTMSRAAWTLLGVCLITILYGFVAFGLLVVFALGDCALGDAQITGGHTCTSLGEY